MKNRILILAAVTLLCQFAYSQNFVGNSRRTIVNKLQEKGYVVKSAVTKYGQQYLSVFEDEFFKAYYFNENNECEEYICIFYNTTKEQVEQSLYNNGYIKNSDGKFYDNTYIAEVIPYEQGNGYGVKIFLK